MTAADALRYIRRAGAPGCPISHIPDGIADQLLGMGAIWQAGEVYYGTAQTGDAPNYPPEPETVV